MLEKYPKACMELCHDLLKNNEEQKKNRITLIIL